MEGGKRRKKKFTVMPAGQSSTTSANNSNQWSHAQSTPRRSSENCTYFSVHSCMQHFFHSEIGRGNISVRNSKCDDDWPSCAFNQIICVNLNQSELEVYRYMKVRNSRILSKHDVVKILKHHEIQYIRIYWSRSSIGNNLLFSVRLATITVISALKYWSSIW